MKIKRFMCILLTVTLSMTTLFLVPVNASALDCEDSSFTSFAEKMLQNATMHLQNDLADTLNSIRLFKPLEDTYQQLTKSYIGGGYYTILLDDSRVSAYAITFPFIYNNKIISVYDVIIDTSGNVISGNYHNDGSFYERYKHEDGVYIVDGMYDSYILKCDNSLINTSYKIDDFTNTSSKTDICKIKKEFINDNLGVDIEYISNRKVTNANQTALRYNSQFISNLSKDTTVRSSTLSYNLSIPVIGQGNYFICWAACIAMIRNYRFSQWTVTPSDIVNNSPVFPGSFNARNFSDIRDTIYPYFIGTLNTHYSSLTPSIVISEIDSNSPLYLHTESASSTNNDIDDSLYHAVVGYGYYSSATTDRLWIIDPFAEDHEGGYLSITYNNSSRYGTYRLGGTANGGLMEVWYTITY